VTARAAELSPADAAKLLEERAKALARPLAAAGPSTPTRSCLTFALGGETYAVEARCVRGVFRLTELAPLPGAPELVAGVTLWRGELLVVLDLRRALELGGTGLDDRAWVVAIADERRALGLLAGALRGLEPIADDDLRAAEPVAAGGSPRPLRGVTPAAIQLLDAAALLERQL
jgi:purine-binding chemotaxis protein CheW